jgi:dipeptidyl-peptidase-4
MALLTSEPAVHGAVVGGDVVVVRSSSLERDGIRTTVMRDGHHVADLRSFAAPSGLRPAPSLLRVGARALATAVLLPAGHDGTSPLPVLLDPYGGPHAQRVLRTRSAFVASQWLADQGFAVVIADGRGTPGRGTEWERAVHFDLAGPVLEDQVDALHGAAERHPELDLTRVAIRGWSFGGYLAALAVLRRPDVFHAAVAGAPVTEWRLYDTHYTERYLGDPTVDPEPYDRTSLLRDAHRLERPLLLVHGLADDNVVAAHTLQLSRALLEAGRPHQVLPLSGVTHMTPQEVVAENLLVLQVAFLRHALGLSPRV